MFCVVVVWWCLLRVASMVDVYCLSFAVEYVLLGGVVCCVLCGVVRVLLLAVCVYCWVFDVHCPWFVVRCVLLLVLLRGVICRLVRVVCCS